ncbi:hypothetical protein [Bacillus subtilis]|uniref:hypothetical protein n=1 Tax=Bacillus subtilis TaxID=1423 RepID=UPI001B917241|nr:hypothetical protein [Bacillus subtilis]CAI6330846.1 hypothetical protein NRS6096_22120 [Bacillus subtilis]
MEFLKIKFYLDILNISFTVTYVFYVVPINVFLGESISFLDYFLALLNAYFIVNHNGVYQTLIEKWFKK